MVQSLLFVHLLLCSNHNRSYPCRNRVFGTRRLNHRGLFTVSYITGVPRVSRDTMRRTVQEIREIRMEYHPLLVEVLVLPGSLALLRASGYSPASLLV